MYINMCASVSTCLSHFFPLVLSYVCLFCIIPLWFYFIINFSTACIINFSTVVLFKERQKECRL